MKEERDKLQWELAASKQNVQRLAEVFQSAAAEEEEQALVQESESYSAAPRKENEIKQQRVARPRKKLAAREATYVKEGKVGRP